MLPVGGGGTGLCWTLAVWFPCVLHIPPTKQNGVCHVRIPFDSVRCEVGMWRLANGIEVPLLRCSAFLQSEMLLRSTTLAHSPPLSLSPRVRLQVADPLPTLTCRDTQNIRNQVTDGGGIWLCCCKQQFFPKTCTRTVPVYRSYYIHALDHVRIM